MEVRFKRPWRGHPLGRVIMVADNDPQALECDLTAELISGGYCEEIVKNAPVFDVKPIKRVTRKSRGRKAAPADSEQ